MADLAKTRALKSNQSETRYRANLPSRDDGNPQPPSAQATVNVNIPDALGVLNNAYPPYLTRDELNAIYNRVAQAVTGGSTRPLTFDETVTAVGPLAELVHAVKQHRLREQAARQRPLSGIMNDPTPTLTRFLTEAGQLTREGDELRMRDYLIIEPKPEYPHIYMTMIAELRQTYPKGSEDALEDRCGTLLPLAREGVDGASWTAFIKFMVQYLVFIRDFNKDNLLDTYTMLSELVQKCNTALGHPSLGVIVLPTAVAYSSVLARIAIGLDKRPELIAHLPQQSKSTDEGGVNETLPEKAANTVRQVLVTCLSDRSGTAPGAQDGRPEGKKSAIYKLANLCFKILFQCRKTRGAEQIILNIYQLSPPLSIYPRAERVTYLYYLGRFLFTNNHFYRAQLALQAAYDQCRPKASNRKQRHLILIFLIASNITLGRFPSQNLYQRPEAVGLAERFQPLCRAVAKGDLATFRRLTEMKNGHTAWFVYYRIFFQLRNRCEVLVWRSLIRKTFVLNGTQGAQVVQDESAPRKAPTLDLHDILHLMRFLEKRALMPLTQLDNGPGRRHTNWVFMGDTPSAKETYVDPDLDGAPGGGKPGLLLPDMLEVESIVASLVDQGFLNGFVSHKQLRFAITGAKKRGALVAGFPKVWEVVRSRSDDEVPGWKKEQARRVFGRVVAADDEIMSR